MKIIKLIYHINAFFKKIAFKLIYGKKIKFGRHVTFRKSFSLMIDKNAKISIGNNVFFNNYCTISSMSGVSIGNDCIFGEGVKIYDNDHAFNKEAKIKDSGYHVSAIEIGDNCWIANNVIILRGAKIGSNCVIGAGCIVRGGIPDNTILKNKDNYVQETIRKGRE